MARASTPSWLRAPGPTGKIAGSPLTHPMPSLLRIFRRPDYQSDVTQFIEQLKSERPDLESRQRAGRSLLWDRQIDREAQADWRAARVPHSRTSTARSR